MVGKKRYWHYTVWTYLKNIRNDEVIKTTSLYVPKGVKPVAWFSTNTDWEPTMFKGIINSETGKKVELTKKSDYIKHGMPLVRIEVDPETANLRGWNNYKKNSGESKRAIKGLEKIANQVRANPKDWFVSYEDVSVDCILSIEVWNGSAWVDLKSLDEEEQIKLQQSHQ